MPANDAGGTLAVPAPTAAKRPGRIVYARYLEGRAAQPLDLLTSHAVASAMLGAIGEAFAP
jgi:hypothetical protein